MLLLTLLFHNVALLLNVLQRINRLVNSVSAADSRVFHSDQCVPDDQVVQPDLGQVRSLDAGGLHHLRCLWNQQ